MFVAGASFAGPAAGLVASVTSHETAVPALDCVVDQDHVRQCLNLSWGKQQTCHIPRHQLHLDGPMTSCTPRAAQPLPLPRPRNVPPAASGSDTRCWAEVPVADDSAVGVTRGGCSVSLYGPSPVLRVSRNKVDTCEPEQQELAHRDREGNPSEVEPQTRNLCSWVQLEENNG